ncbi:hypothetical protein BX600DRAFT_17302 [Xylariales sp. PMI_506]|nr:hypothetical protein BX600DRAFT_17302 [Xylariales sp. PMI_506]
MSDAESDDGKRASKKRKASRACDRCNVQHQPCDNASPKCSVCERAGTECTYNRPVRKRGPRTGYTAQFGERLWGLVLQANPSIEDMVIKLLASGTYGNTGVSNADYFKNNDHQSELVNLFNESRLGHFVQTGELPSLQSLRSNPTAVSGSSRTPEDLLTDPQYPGMKNPQGSDILGGRSGISAISKLSPGINPHGAPQNPGDIYTLSDDIRKRSSLSQTSPGSQLQENTPEAQAKAPDWQSLMASTATSGTTSTTFGPYGNGLLQTNIDSNRLSGLQALNRTSGLQQAAGQGMVDSSLSFMQQGGTFDFDFPNMNQWYDSTPTDTLLNLGFTAGEGMAADFLDLCENPDPIQSAPLSPTNHNEDEEAVWRRLVMRGRFV